MYFKQFYDPKLSQYSYMIACQADNTAIVIDPLRDIEPYIEVATREGFTLIAAADTHIHADYISGLREFAERGIKVYASDEGDDKWKYEWLIGSDYNHELLHDGDKIHLGNITLQAWHTPGHTPEHLSYIITDGAATEEPVGMITGDFVFVGDVGRPDLLETAAGVRNVMIPSAKTLYKSIRNLKEFPDYLQIWPGHGSGSACGKAMGALPETTLGYERLSNASLKAADSEENFVSFILKDQPEPPLYFARMKKENKEGPAVLKTFPQPQRLTLTEIGRLNENDSAVLLDTRSRQEFTAGHISGSVLSPFNRQFNTIAGSYISSSSDIYLVIDEKNVQEAVTDLIRVGLDRIKGYIIPEDLSLYKEEGGELEPMRTETFEAVENATEDQIILDVRSRSEYEEAHADGAVNMAHLRLPERLDDIPSEKQLLVHCQTGVRSAAAAALLKHKGFEVTLIDDDFNRYREKSSSII